MEKFTEILEQVNTETVPQIKGIVIDNAVLLAVAAFIIVLVYRGYRRGLVDRAISLGSVLLTLAAEIKVFPYVSAFIKNNETVHEILMNITKSLMNSDSTRMKSPLYDILQLDLLADNAVDMMGELAARILCFILIFIAVRIAVGFAASLISILKRISVVDSIDRLLGAAFGFAEAIILVWLSMLVVSAFPGISICRFILDQIMRDQVLMSIYNQNLVLMFINDILGR